MENVYLKARAKVNLTLNVLDKRQDGYHNLETIFQKINLYDEIYISKTDKHDDIEIDINVPSLQKEENIIFKAYKLLKDKFNNITGVNVILKKNIPMQAGLAGGSTDCASFILGMNKLFDLNLNKESMIEIGKRLGADVPQGFFNTPIVARGIGEIIEKIKTDIKYYILLIKPEFSCNTKEMFKKLDEGNGKAQKYNAEKVRMALEEGNIIEVANNLYNVFETEVYNIESIKKELIDAGALGSLMSGAGSVVFGIFEDKEKAKRGYKILSEKYETYYCISYIK